MNQTPPPPLLGFNNNVRHQGRIFHIQTEDSGVKYPRVVTHLFADGGRIVKTSRTDYAEHVGEENMAQHVRRLMKEQHKAMFIALRTGELDDIIEQTCGPPPQPAPSRDEKAEAPKSEPTQKGKPSSHPPPAARDQAAAEAASALHAVPARTNDAPSREGSDAAAAGSADEAGCAETATVSANAPGSTAAVAAESKGADLSQPKGKSNKKGASGRPARSKRRGQSRRPRSVSNPNLRKVSPSVPPPARTDFQLDVDSLDEHPPQPSGEADGAARPGADEAAEARGQDQEGQAAPRPSAAFGEAPTPESSSIFGESVISEKSLDEVILSYLAEDLDEEASGDNKG